MDLHLFSYTFYLFLIINPNYFLFVIRIAVLDDPYPSCAALVLMYTSFNTFSGFSEFLNFE
jgi:hypothetical protein